MLAAGALAAVTTTGKPPVQAGKPAQAAKPAEAEVPTALAAHLEKLHQAVPGNGGESEDGPGAAEEAAFLARAYPAKTISLAKVRGAMASFQQAQSRAAASAGRSGAAATAGGWENIGPSRALYPFTRFRNSGNYVPNRYIAGGRTTSIAIAPTCQPGNCRVWITPAGGGVWRTNDALNRNPSWTYLGGPLGINAAGEVALDPNDPSAQTVYVGTGEANICGSGCVAGVGIYKSTNGGQTWQGPLGGDVLSGKGVGDIVVQPGNPKVVYAATTTALRGYSSVCCAGVTRPVPDAAQWGLYKSTDGGTSWKFIHNGARRASDCRGDDTEFANNRVCSPRGVRHLKLDPVNPRIVYASSYARGIWRSNDAGATWTQIKESLNPLLVQTRAAFDVTKLPNGKTRMYVHEGNIGVPYSRLFRSDDVATGAPTFTDLTSSDPADPGYATYNQCDGQCWYDLFVYTPHGYPDVVYTGGSYVYAETGGISNGRGVVLSTNAGVSGTDMTMDGTDRVHPNGLHPDQHAMVTRPGHPFQFLETNDGGVMLSNGRFANRSRWCNARDFSGYDEDAATARARCRQLLSRVPDRLDGQNEGLTTLQWQMVKSSPHDVDLIVGGTQDNGTWETNGNRVTWRNIMIGDGGYAGFDVKRKDFRFHDFFDVTPEVSFNGGSYGSWIWTADPLFGLPGNQFYSPVINDPRVSGTMFAGTGRGVFRTKTFGIGDRTLAEAQRICNTWTGTFEETCGDWEILGPTDLTSEGWGTTRSGGAVSQIDRADGNKTTAWASTTTGRLFVSTNVNAEPASAVRWDRIDEAATPTRFISGIHVDPTNPNRAWISYSGYNKTTPGEPGHVFQVVYNPGTGQATWTDLSFNLADLPITHVARDDKTGDIYAASDFGVLRLGAGTFSWDEAAPGLPNVEVTYLDIRPNARILYAASHGLGTWRLRLR